MLITTGGSSLSTGVALGVAVWSREKLQYRSPGNDVRWQWICPWS